MNIKLDGVAYTVTPEQERAIIERIWQVAEQHYAKLEGPLRLAMKPVAREILRRMEKSKPEAAELFRPAKGADPVEHLATMIFALIQEGIQHVEVAISTSEHRLTDIHFQKRDTGASGG